MLFAREIQPEHKREFLLLIREGHKANTAAREIGSTGTQFRRLKSRGGEHYDEEFARAWFEAEHSDEHDSNRRERIRALVDERAETSDAILTKLAMAELPEWEKLRHQNFGIDIKILAARVLPGLSDDELTRAIQAAEAAEIETAEVRELPERSAA